MASEEVDEIRRKIKKQEEELQSLKKQLADAQNLRHESREEPFLQQGGVKHSPNIDGEVKTEWGWPLDPDEYTRYGRQMILPSVGLQGFYVRSGYKASHVLTTLCTGQLRLRDAKVLLVGLGGLGCPAAQYLAGAGIGTLGLMDGDTVEMSNLHRQILHTTDRVGMLKVESAYESLKQ